MSSAVAVAVAVAVVVAVAVAVAVTLMGSPGGNAVTSTARWGMPDGVACVDRSCAWQAETVLPSSSSAPSGWRSGWRSKRSASPPASPSASGSRILAASSRHALSHALRSCSVSTSCGPNVLVCVRGVAVALAVVDHGGVAAAAAALTAVAAVGGPAAAAEETAAAGARDDRDAPGSTSGMRAAQRPGGLSARRAR